MQPEQIYQTAIVYIAQCLGETNRKIADGHFIDAYNLFLTHYALQRGLIRQPTNEREAVRNLDIVLEHSGEIESLFNQRDLYNLIVAAEHIGRQEDSAKLKAILKQQQPSLDIETSVRVWKRMAYANLQRSKMPDEKNKYVTQFQTALRKAKEYDYDGAIAELEGIISNNPSVRAEKELFLGTLYLMKFQNSGLADVASLQKSREHLENEVKSRGNYSKQGLESLALISSVEGGFRGPSLEGRTLKAYKP